MSAYASSLQSLRIDEDFILSVEQNDLRMLAQFTKMESLILYPVMKDGLNLDLNALGPMPNLLELTVRVLFLDLAAANWIAAHSKLNALSYDTLWRDDPPEEDLFSYLNQFTRLSFNCPEIETSVMILSRLVDLTIHLDYSYNLDMFDFSLVLQELPQLERLVLWCQHLYVPSSVLQSLRKLRCLHLDAVLVDMDLFTTLASFSDLTELVYKVANVDDVDFEMNKMSKLVTLVCGTSEVRPTACVDCLARGWFPHLQRLELDNARLNEEEERHLRERMPCLRVLIAKPV